MLRGIAAIALGYLIFTAGGIAFFQMTGSHPRDLGGAGFMIGAWLYAVFFAMLAGFVTAWVAPKYEFEHSLTVASLIAVAGAATIIAKLGVRWIQFAALLTTAPMAMLGGYFRRRQIVAARLAAWSRHEEV
jgi:hypothetical protein